MPESQIAVNIVAWHSLAYLPAFFESLNAQTVPLRVTVVDNASTDGSGAWIAGNHPHIGMLRNMRNYGFARAHNQAILLALNSWRDADLSHRYIVVCNPDIELDAACLERMFTFMESHPEADACAPKLLRAHLEFIDVDNKETVRTNVIDATGISFSRALRTYDRGAGEEDKKQYDELQDVFGASGALGMYRASSVQKASVDQQFYDEDFFAYQEDVDAAWRMRHLGMRTVYLPQAVAWHHRRAQSKNKIGWMEAWKLRRAKPTFINYLSSRNHVWVLVKNLTLKEFWHCALWLLLYEFAKFCASLISFSSLKGYFAALTGLPLMLRKRKRYLKDIVEPFRNQSAWFN
ncbi:MAG: glycosyltransferase family 2 protein [Patescibacteria group bacterium]|nr:glycosyltransferase family 2 protein [Patescibacteria group bacterium]